MSQRLKTADQRAEPAERWRFILLIDDPRHVLPRAESFSSAAALARAQQRHPGSRTREILVQ